MKKFSFDSFKLDGKIAVVTGGCGNLGPFWVLSLLQAGARVAIIDLPNSKAPEILQIYKSPKLNLYFADITQANSLTDIHNTIHEEMGNIGILVNNAGIDAPPTQKAKTEDVTTRNKLFSKMWEVNAQGMVNCIEEFYRDMEKTGGSIVNIGSLYMERSPDEGLYTHLGFDKPWAYGATKAAVGQITRHFATRLAKFNIRVNTLSPGGVFANQNVEFIRKYSQKVPLGRLAIKETDLGGPLIFLCSEASGYVTGINLQVNGGYTAW